MYFNNMIEYTLLKRNLNVEPMGKNLLLLIVTLLFLILKFSNTVEATRVCVFRNIVLTIQKNFF